MVSLILGILGLGMFWLFGVVPLTALILAMQSRAATKGAGLPMRGTASAGAILGALGILGAVLVLLQFFDDLAQGRFN
jgi:hypothetical protein